MKIGQRVHVRHLMSNEKLFGHILIFDNEPRKLCGIDTLGVAVVKLDNQITPLVHVLCYKEYPEIVPAAYWQFCWPIDEPNPTPIS